MGNTSENGGRRRKQLCIGLLAHVDAGKTTLSEGLLYLCGNLRSRGRVDDENTYLDNDAMERERGITIFSKQAILDVPGENTRITLLDTPGHVDFSSEMERTLQVMDYAILLIGGKDGVQGHTMTLWRLLEHYRIPVFLFVNKMDQEGSDRAALLAELQKRLDGSCVDFSDPDREAFMENASMCDEALMESYLETGDLPAADLALRISDRKLFPVYFGSALKMDGVEEFLKGISLYTLQKEYPAEFGARIYKISRDEQSNRLTFLKVTGGSLKVKELLSGRIWLRETGDGQEGPEEGAPAGERVWTEKVDQIRLYSGPKYELVQEAEAGCVCAVTGLSMTFPGEGIGIEPPPEVPVLEPVLDFTLLLPSDCNVNWMLRNMRELEEEDPQLHIVWDPHLKEIHVMLMGEVQTEILKRVIWDRFHVAADFGPGSIVYKETIAAPVIGVGHFEPLRHYAEVHLLLEPGEPGSGLTVFTACSEDVLAKNWQRLILTHLMEKEHVGVLTGSAVTDLQITLIGGRAHIKHTEGGDFRQATYRAVRNGLKKADSVLLEPYYEFRIELPVELAGRAMTDIQKMGGTFLPLEMDGDVSVLRGSAPVSAMREYPKEVVAYSGGRGRIFCSLKGYAPVADQEEIVSRIGYDSESDLDNPTGSVFCAHGAGFIVPWYQVEEYMHLDDQAEFKDLVPGEDSGQAAGFPQGYAEGGAASSTGRRKGSSGASAMGSYEEDQELMAIFERTFGPIKSRTGQNTPRHVNFSSGKDPYGADYAGPGADRRAGKRGKPHDEPGDEYLLVDGYNIIFAWKELRELAEKDIHAAAQKLIDIMGNYQGITGSTVIIVFDAYKVEGHREEIMKFHNIDVVYTREAETADMFIARTAHRLGKNNRVSVATSDAMEQIIIMGGGALRLSASTLKQEVEAAEKQMQENWRERRVSGKVYLLDDVPEDLIREL